VRARRRVGTLSALCLALLVVVMALPSGSAAQPGGVFRTVSSPDRPPLLDDGDLPSLRAAVQHSLTWLDRQPAGRLLGFGPRRVTMAEYATSLRRLLGLLADDPAPDVLEERISEEFEVVSSVGRADGAVLITGYHEPVVEVAAQSSPEYSVPVLGVPAAGEGWRRCCQPSRADIEAGRLGTGVRPLAWARDAVDVFFMEVEGSGTLRFPDGREVRVGPGATNGRPYRSIGRLLIDEGWLTEETVSMGAIRSWLASRSAAERARVLRHNEAIVFFRRLDGPPVGNLGVPLTPARSIATDARLFPPAALAFVRAERPFRLTDGRVVWGPMNRFVMNQDTGGAIRGPGRVDVFWGRGPEADLAASEMKQLGELYLLVPRTTSRLAAGPSSGDAQGTMPR
jgi:membrane-bound lytic murein transglycosylase A